MTEKKTRSREGWTRVRFGDVVRLATERCADPLAAGIERYVGLEHLEPSDLRIRTWGNVADGVTFTNRFHAGQVLFGKRRAYQRKVAVADFDGVCSGDIYVFEPADDRLLPELLPFICQTEGFFEHALKTSAGSLSPRTNWKSLQEYEFDLPPVEEQRRLSSAFLAGMVTRECWDTATQCAMHMSNQIAAALLTGCFADLPRHLHSSLQPDTWGTKTLGELCTLGSGHGFGPSDWGTDGYPIIRIQNVRGSTDFNYYSGSPDPRWIVEPGELLFAWAGVPGVSFGPGIWNGPTAVLNQHIYRVTPTEDVDTYWLYEVLRYMTPAIERRAHGFKTSLLHIKKQEFTSQVVKWPGPSQVRSLSDSLRAARRCYDVCAARATSAQSIYIAALKQLAP
jgi:type I restriction enzyme S subunit